MTVESPATHLTEQTICAIVDGASSLVSPADRLHAAACAQCTRRLDEARESSRLVGALFAGDVTSSVDLEAMIHVALEKQREPSTVPMRSLLLAGGIGAALTLVCGVVSLWPLDVSSMLRNVHGYGRAVLALGSVVARAVPGGLSGIGLFATIALVLLSLGLRKALRFDVARGAAAAVALCVVVASTIGAHAQELAGTWPPDEAHVTIAATRTLRSRVLLRLADDASLGLVVSLPDDPRIDVQLRDVTVADAFRAVLAGTGAVVTRTGAMVSVHPPAAANVVGSAATNAGGFGGAPSSSPTTGPSPAAHVASTASTASAASPPANAAPNAAPSLPTPTPSSPGPSSPVSAAQAPARVMPAPGASPSPSPSAGASPPDGRTAHVNVGVRGDDRVTLGDDVRIGPRETVRNVVTMGGDVTVEGRVTRDVVTMGGDVHVARGGVVMGQIVTAGGELVVDEGGTVHDVVGAADEDDEDDESAHAASAARGQGDSSRSRATHRGRRGLDLDFGLDEANVTPKFARDAMRSASSYGLLFLLGLLILGAAPARLDVLRRAIVRRPARSLGTGIAGVAVIVTSSLAFFATIVGIPVSVLLVLLGGFFGYVGLAVAAAVVGGAMPLKSLEGRPVTQLVVGVVALYSTSLVPYVGVALTALAVLMGVGAMLITRLGRDVVS